MKLIDFLSNNSFIELIQKMNAPITPKFNFNLHEKKLINLNFLEHKNDSQLFILENFNLVSQSEDNTLVFANNKRVVLYIRDYIKKENYSYPKFHISECNTIKQFRQQNKANRFVIHTRDDELFHLNEIEKDEVNAVIVQLKVCSYCLKNINWHGDEFSLKKFFERYPKDFIINKPRFTSENAPLNNYSSYWPEISYKTKKACNFCCEECKLYLGDSENLSFLHVHHINGEKNDNRKENLKTLCYECHSNQPDHWHMKKEALYESFIKLRKSLET